MIRTKNLLPDRQRALIEWLSLPVLTLNVVQLRKIFKARGYIKVIWTMNFFCGF